MIRKIIYFAIIIYGLFFFYEKFVASTVEPFFKKNSGNVDLYQLNTKQAKEAESVLKTVGAE